LGADPNRFTLLQYVVLVGINLADDWAAFSHSSLVALVPDAALEKTPIVPLRKQTTAYLHRTLPGQTVAATVRLVAGSLQGT
jgi:hypothetical protein